MESRVKNNNFYVVQAFMVNDLLLKGLEKDIYAIIYGFSQAEDQWYDGSLQYLADWTSSTKQGVLKALKSLKDKDLIEKQETYFNSVKFVKYRSTEFNGGIKQSLTGGIKQSLTNNKDIDNKVNNKYKDVIVKVIDYLNEKIGSKYSYTGLKQVTCIKARINEKFGFEDFKKVIDKKVKDWKGNEFEKYLRPETLFGSKFESYLNEKTGKGSNNREYTEKEFNGLINDIDLIEI